MDFRYLFGALRQVPQFCAHIYVRLPSFAEVQYLRRCQQSYTDIPIIHAE